MPAVGQLSRVGERVVESGPAVRTPAGEIGSGWKRRGAGPGRRPGRADPTRLACLVAIAVCAFTGGRETTGSPRSGSGSTAPARRTWPGCARRGIRSPGGTGRRMRRRSGWCWTVLTPGPWPRLCSGRVRAVAGALAGRLRPACVITVPAARPGRHKRWPGNG